MKTIRIPLYVSVAGLLAALPAAYAANVAQPSHMMRNASAQYDSGLVQNCAEVGQAAGDSQGGNNKSCVDVLIPFDYGDAPDPKYPVLATNQGARHQLGTEVYLGKCVDADSGTLQGLAKADDQDASKPAYGNCANDAGDEDGVSLPELRVGSKDNSIQVTANKACKLNAWVDWDQDGNWGEGGERIFYNQKLEEGENRLTLSVPELAKEGATYARFRCSTAGDDLIGGEAADGEVEDYQIEILPALPKKAVAVGDYIWIDTNKDGKQDEGEQGLEGATVTLHHPDGSVVTLDGVPVETGTNSAGRYVFIGLPEGDYYISVKPPQGYAVTIGGVEVDGNPVNTDNNCKDVGSTVRTSLFNLAAGTEPENDGNGRCVGTCSGKDGLEDKDANFTVDCGFVKQEVQPDPVSVGDYIWLDSNKDGKQDADEQGLAGVVVTLLDKDGKPVKDISGNEVAPVTTGDDGKYGFTKLPEGQYQIKLTVPAGYQPTKGGVAVDEDDSNTDSNCKVETGQSIGTGLFTLTAGSEPGAALDGDGSNNNQTVDCGLVKADTPVDPPPPSPVTGVSVGNQLWVDNNANGKREKDEPMLAGAIVTLTDAAGHEVKDLDGNVVAPQTTGADGLYRFTNLPEGDYVVTVQPPKGYFLTVGGIDPDDDDNDYDSNCRINPLNGTVNTPVFSLHAGKEPTADGDDANSNQTVDCGFFPTVGVGNRIWLDVNGDGKQDADEPGVGGVTVTLLDADGITPATDAAGAKIPPYLTKADGHYQFSNLKPGDYVVAVTPAADAGYVLTKGGHDPDDDLDKDSNCKASGGRFQTPAVTLSPGQEPDSKVDGDDAHTNSTVDCGLLRPFTLSNRLWIDLDGNGKQDAGEPGVPGATITLLTVDGKPVTDIFGEVVKPQQTGPDGKYFFGNLREGQYVLKVNPPPGYLPTVASSNPNDNVANNSDGILAPDGSIMTKPFDLREGPGGSRANLTVGFGLLANLHVPTLGHLGLMLLSLLLGAVAMFRRRQH